MPPTTIHWAVPTFTTTSVEAAAHYRDGITALVSGMGIAERSLQAAVALDPWFLVARVGLGVCAVTSARPYVAPELERPVGRAERQHAEIVDTMINGDRRHATDLRREHLLEFPGDLLIVWLPLVTVAERS
jgi:hypothetical protein